MSWRDKLSEQDRQRVEQLGREFQQQGITDPDALARQQAERDALLSQDEQFAEMRDRHGSFEGSEVSQEEVKQFTDLEHEAPEAQPEQEAQAEQPEAEQDLEQEAAPEQEQETEQPEVEMTEEEKLAQQDLDMAEIEAGKTPEEIEQERAEYEDGMAAEYEQEQAGQSSESSQYMLFPGMEQEAEPEPEIEAEAETVEVEVEAEPEAEVEAAPAEAEMEAEPAEGAEAEAEPEQEQEADMELGDDD